MQYQKGLSALGIIVTAVVAASSCVNKGELKLKEQSSSGALGASESIRELMEARGLKEADVEAALKTYVPTGKRDDYIIFASGGQSGQVLVIGVPSMRLLKLIGVFSPEPWQGYGYGGDSDSVLAQGTQAGHRITWADVHHRTSRSRRAITTGSSSS